MGEKGAKPRDGNGDLGEQQEDQAPEPPFEALTYRNARASRISQLTAQAGEKLCDHAKPGESVKCRGSSPSPLGASDKDISP
jgi:hypothetical protein